MVSSSSTSRTVAGARRPASATTTRPTVGAGGAAGPTPVSTHRPNAARAAGDHATRTNIGTVTSRATTNSMGAPTGGSTGLNRVTPPSSTTSRCSAHKVAASSMASRNARVALSTLRGDQLCRSGRAGALLGETSRDIDAPTEASSLGALRGGLRVGSNPPAPTRRTAFSHDLPQRDGASTTAISLRLERRRRSEPLKTAMPSRVEYRRLVNRPPQVCMRH